MLSTSVPGTVFELELPLTVTADTLPSMGVPAHRLFSFGFDIGR
jgi:hypothetical protein